jgi:hypothetical protein
VKKKPEVKHVDSGHARGKEHHREVKVDPTKTLGRVVTSDRQTETTPTNAERDADKMALFQRDGSGNSDAVSYPGVSGREWNPDDVSKVEGEGH